MWPGTSARRVRCTSTYRRTLALRWSITVVPCNSSRSKRINRPRRPSMYQTTLPCTRERFQVSMRSPSGVSSSDALVVAALHPRPRDLICQEDGGGRVQQSRLRLRFTHTHSSYAIPMQLGASCSMSEWIRKQSFPRHSFPSCDTVSTSHSSASAQLRASLPPPPQYDFGPRP